MSKTGRLDDPNDAGSERRGFPVVMEGKLATEPHQTDEASSLSWFPARGQLLRAVYHLVEGHTRQQAPVKSSRQVLVSDGSLNLSIMDSVEPRRRSVNSARAAT